MVELACAVVVASMSYVAVMVWSVARRAHRVLDHMEKQIEPPSQPIQLRPGRWAR